MSSIKILRRGSPKIFVNSARTLLPRVLWFAALLMKKRQAFQGKPQISQRKKSKTNLTAAWKAVYNLRLSWLQRTVQSEVATAAKFCTRIIKNLQPISMGVWRAKSQVTCDQVFWTLNAHGDRTKWSRQDFSFNSVFMSFLRVLGFGLVRGVENYCRD